MRKKMSMNLIALVTVTFVNLIGSSAYAQAVYGAAAAAAAAAATAGAMGNGSGRTVIPSNVLDQRRASSRQSQYYVILGVNSKGQLIDYHSQCYKTYETCQEELSKMSDVAFGDPTYVDRKRQEGQFLRCAPIGLGTCMNDPRLGID